MRRKDDNGCTEVRNREEVSALMYDEKYRGINKKHRQSVEQQAVELTTFRQDASSSNRNES